MIDAVELQGSDRSLEVHLEEYRIMRKELDASIQESERWLQFSLTLTAAFVAGGLAAAQSEDAKLATPLLMILGSTYVSFAALLYLRGDIKRARVLKYFSEWLFPAIRASADDLALLAWHQFSRGESDGLRSGTGFDLSWLQWGYLGRTLVYFFLVAGSAVFLGVGIWLLAFWEFRPTADGVLFMLRSGAAVSAVWLLSVLLFGWQSRRQPGSHGG